MYDKVVIENLKKENVINEEISASVSIQKMAFE